MFLLANRSRNDFPSTFVVFRAFRKVCEVSKVPRLSAKSRVRALVPRVMSLAQGCLEKRRKSIPKSIRNRRKSRLGTSRAPLSVDFCRSKRTGRAIQRDSAWLGRLRRPSRLARWATTMGQARRDCELAGLVGQRRYRLPRHHNVPTPSLEEPLQCSLWMYALLQVLVTAL